MSLRWLCRLRMVLLVVALVCGASVGYFLWGRWSVRAPQASGRVALFATDADVEVRGVHVVEDRRGRKEWELWADRARVYRRRGVTVFEKVRLRIFPRDEERKPLLVRGEEGVLHNESRDVEVRGDVVVVSDEGYTLSTQSLRWRAAKKEFSTEDPVTVEGEKLRITGHGMVAHSESQQVRLGGRVRATFY
ncbi:MAG: LPS export ABC transporter periplasmic protein LptC [Nitrospinota bacterium]